MKIPFQRKPFQRPSPMAALTVTMVVLLAGCTIQPQKFAPSELIPLARDNIKALSHTRENISTPLTLYDAMAHAIKYNREYRLNRMRSALSLEQSELDRFDMFPDLAANAGYNKRDNDAASSSQSHRTGQESLEPSISQDRERRNFDAAFTWNVLDFGLSYVRAQQQSDQYLISREMERKTIHNIIVDVRMAWWKALSAQRLLIQIPDLMGEVEKVLQQSETIGRQRLDNPMAAFKYQRSLLYMLRTLEDLQEQLLGAKPELAHLMGLPPDMDLAIADPGTQSPIPMEMAWDVRTMERITLISRPEIMESYYQERITQKESRIALLRLLPNLNLDAGWNYDANSYLVHHSWYNFGGRLTTSLLDLLKLPATLDHTQSSEALQKQQQRVIASTVLMQLHLAKAAHIQKVKRYELEDKIFTTEDRILQHKLAENTAETDGAHALIEQRLSHLLAQFRKETAHAEMRNAFGRLLWTMGVDPVPSAIDQTPVDELAGTIQAQLEKWQKNRLNHVEGLGPFVRFSTPDLTHVE